MRKLFLIAAALLIASSPAFAAAKDNKCYALGSSLIEKLSGCHLEKSSRDTMDYTCDNGFVFIDKPTGFTTLILEDARGKLSMGVDSDVCFVELLDEYGVAVIPAGKLPKGSNGRGLYSLFKEKFMSSQEARP